MRAHSMSPNTPASVTPLASTTATEPAGIASMAARVEIGAPHDAGVAKSSRAGTNLKVKAGPTIRPNPDRRGAVPRIQTFRRPFLRRTVVSVAVEIVSSALCLAGSSGIFVFAPVTRGLGLPPARPLRSAVSRNRGTFLMPLLTCSKRAKPKLWLRHGILTGSRTLDLRLCAPNGARSRQRNPRISPPLHTTLDNLERTVWQRPLKRQGLIC